ncbi:iron ABC transporter permease [Mycoavidus sp. HKI]|uniref:FecCD family ABC transporter permease n=1 Tax=Mycoavidus sp. HKI TaxID=2840467 RepID=UPI001CBD0900|nr:iron ABC transporter permease [Mycoavidus sp. HKI]UAW64963.2 iron ABC transporter permease [Mycoavidus sp. HKI]
MIKTMTLRRAVIIWSVLLLLAVTVFLASLATGSVTLSVAQLLRVCFGDEDSVAAQIVHTVRIPRAVAGFACGALLSVAGALLQILLRNPLADPYVLGVSGGAASFALGAMMLSLPTLYINLCAFAGALAAIMMLLFATRRTWLQRASHVASSRLLLTGVVLATGWGALIILLMTLAPERALRGMVFWLVGDLSSAAHGWFALIVLAGVLVVSLSVATQLNVLLRGEATAYALGVAVVPLRRRIYWLASLATAAAVSTAGSVGFIGLVVPHGVRLLLGNDQRMLLPAAALAGGALTMMADLVARTVVAPVQLPLGAITALIGVPVFLWLLASERR